MTEDELLKRNDLWGVPDRIKEKILRLEELEKEVKKLNGVIEQFKKMYNNWYKFKHQLYKE